MRVVYRSGPILRSLLTRVKDPLPMSKLSNVVYEILCECGKVSIGETKRRLETRIKEHKIACEREQTEKSAVAENFYSEEHRIIWNDAKVIQRASRTTFQRRQRIRATGLLDHYLA